VSGKASGTMRDEEFFDYGIDHELTIIGFTARALSSRVAPLDASACNPSKTA
jgi:hypothetical protein